MSYPQAVADKYTGGVISRYYTPLGDAAAAGDIEKMEFCLEHGMDVNAKDSDGWLPLVAAANAGKLEAVKFLIERGADPKLKTLGKPALWYAEKNGHADVVAYLKSVPSGTAAAPRSAAARTATGAAGAASGAATAAATVTGSPYDRYIAKVDALRNRIKTDESVGGKIVKEFNKLGEAFFGKTHSGYVAPDAPDDYDDEEQFEKLTKKEFAEKYEEDSRTKPVGSEASFSDAFRHAGLIDIKTLKMYPFEHKGVPNADHVISWPGVTLLPDLLNDTDLVALHGDTEGGELLFFFPIPTKPKAATTAKPKTAKAATRTKKGANARRSRRLRR
jgi:hypothetical protein